VNSAAQFEIQAYGNTHTGMVRDSNQDSLGIEADLGLYLVADGMGGRAGGEVASQLAVKTITEQLRNSILPLFTQELPFRRSCLDKIINEACLKIYERSLELPQYRGMGTTTTLLWIPPHEYQGVKGQNQNTAIVAHVGDSRCYLFRNKFLYQVTDDHSLVNEQVKAGLLKKNDPLANQIRNVITRCVGYQEEEEVDTFLIDMMHEDVFLLCSDGLTNKIREVEIAEHMSKEDLNKSCQELIRIANARGGEDNITVLMVRVLKK
jgi:PPM family protein phosphatase